MYTHIHKYVIGIWLLENQTVLYHSEIEQMPKDIQKICRESNDTDSIKLFLFEYNFTDTQYSPK